MECKIIILIAFLCCQLLSKIFLFLVGVGQEICQSVCWEQCPLLVAVGKWKSTNATLTLGCVQQMKK